MIKSRTYYCKNTATPTVKVTKNDRNKENIKCTQEMTGYYTKILEPDPTGNYVNYNFVAFGILADTVITVRPTDRNQKLEDITLTSAYKASNPDDYIKELDKTSLSYSEFAYADIEMTAANQTVNFNLGEIVYSSVNNNWTALIDNLPLYNKVNNVFYVYRYKIEEIEVDGQPVADSLYEVTSSVSKDGKNTTISNKIKEDAPALPSTGFPCFAHSLPVSRY